MADVWCNDEYLYRKKITIDSSKVPGTQTNYPLLLKTSDANLRDGGNGGHVKSPDGYDIVFYLADCTLLSHEIVNYEPTTGAIVMWVNIPSVASGADTEFYMYYGRNNVLVNPSTTATWNTNYKMVHHCHQLNLADFDDSTSNNNDATEDNGIPIYAHPNGKIYKSIFFDMRFPTASSDWLSCGDNASLKPTNVTLEAWVRFTDDDGRYFCGMPYDDGALWDAPYLAYSLMKPATNNTIFHGNEDINYRSIDDGVAQTINTWYHVVGTYDGVYFRVFVDGVETGISAPFVGTIRYNGSPEFVMGVRSKDAVGEYFKGMIEELRVSNLARPTDYATTVYNNTNEPSTFFSLGIEERTTVFVLSGASYNVRLDMPSPGCEDAKLNKQLNMFEFWSDNYEVHDDGISSQPLMLCGVETVTDGEYDKFKQIWIFQDRHETIEITGLGDCYDAAYIIKEFSFNTTPRHGKYHLTWNMSLERVRDL